MDAEVDSAIDRTAEEVASTADARTRSPLEIEDSTLAAARRELEAMVLDPRTRLEGRLFSGKLDIKRPLGRGGHGDVFLAESAGQRVAVKLYRRSAWMDASLPVSFAVQQVLGDLGVAPAVLGFLDPSDLPGRAPLPGEDSDPASEYVAGVVLEFVEATSTLKAYLNSDMRCSQIENDLRGRDVRFAHLNAEELARSFGRLFARLGLLVGDLDAFLTVDGRILIFDFDMFGVVIDEVVHSNRAAGNRVLEDYGVDPALPPTPDAVAEINAEILHRFEEILGCLAYLSRKGEPALNS